MSKVRYEVVATMGSYKDSSGVEKKRYQKIGVVLQNEKGMQLKIEVIPIEWNGWAFLSEPKPIVKQATNFEDF